MKKIIMSLSELYKIGDIVTLKSHPLFKPYSEIKDFPAQLPPLMLVKEVLIDDLKKKKIFSEELGYKISDEIKYVCVYFNGNKSEFSELTIYHSFLDDYKNLKYYREDNVNDKKFVLDKTLIDEVKNYKLAVNYDFGKIIQFKTKKLEHRKKLGNFKDNILSTFQTPDFILSGIKKETVSDLFYSDGEPKRIISNKLYKVLWFNYFQKKNSEMYLPMEFFVENLEI